MSLKSLRLQCGLNQTELAAISGVNLRSLQDYEQGHKSLYSAKGDTILRLSRALGCRMEDILVEEENNCFSHNLNSENMRNRILAYEKGLRERKAQKIHFPIVTADEYVDMSLIYPTKQRAVENVIMSLRNDARVSSLRLFGSSITIACHKDSDIDFAVGLNDISKDTKNDISEMIQSACDWSADILWLDRLSENDRIFQDIMNGLVLI